MITCILKKPKNFNRNNSWSFIVAEQQRYKQTNADFETTVSNSISYAQVAKSKLPFKESHTQDLSVILNTYSWIPFEVFAWVRSKFSLWKLSVWRKSCSKKNKHQNINLPNSISNLLKKKYTHASHPSVCFQQEFLILLIHQLQG